MTAMRSGDFALVSQPANLLQRGVDVTFSNNSAAANGTKADLDASALDVLEAGVSDLKNVVNSSSHHFGFKRRRISSQTG